MVTYLLRFMLVPVAQPSRYALTVLLPLGRIRYADDADFLSNLPSIFRRFVWSIRAATYF